MVIIRYTGWNLRQIRSMNYFIILESFTFLTNFLKVKKLQKYISTFFCSYLGSWRHLSVKIFCSRCIVKTFRDQTYKYIWRLYTKFQPNRRPGSIQWVRVKFWLLLHSKSLIRKMDESRPLLFFNFRGGLLSSIFPKKSSKCLKMAISWSTLELRPKMVKNQGFTM